MASKKDLNWSELGFHYLKTDYRYVSYYHDGKWDDGQLITDNNLPINESSACLQQAQGCIEGMKAFPTKNGGVQLFRPDMNALRMQESCERILMPTFPVDRFIDACKQVVRANEAYIPPYGTGATLYLRPFIIGVGEHMGGANPSDDYLFCVFATPVSSYYQGGMKPVNYITSESFDRAAPLGTGHAKVIGNYAAALLPHRLAVQAGFADCVYLDALTHTKIDEVGTANFIAVTKDGRIVAPNAPTALRSITKMSLLYLAEHRLGMTVSEEDIYIDRLDQYSEAAVCGTAAAVIPVAGIQHKGNMHKFYDDVKIGPVTQKLYDLYTGIQFGDIEAPEGWIVPVE